MMAQTQPAQGCAVCGGPSDLAPALRGNRVAVGLAGVAFLLVTFLWPRKEKLLAQARRAGETPSRPTASHPARRSRATTQRPLPPTPYLGTDDYAYRLIDPTIARRSRACLPQARSLAGRPDATGKGGPGRPYRPRKGSQSLNTGCNPACRTAAATSPTGRSSWMANCSSSSLSPSA